MSLHTLHARFSLRFIFINKGIGSSEQTLLYLTLTLPLLVGESRDSSWILFQAGFQYVLLGCSVRLAALPFLFPKPH